MLAISVRKRLPGFSLEASWSSSAPVVALVGPSGAGKTLMLQCIAGLVRPDEGRIRRGDQMLFDSGTGRDLPPQARRIGYVFQGYALFPHMTVLQNVRYGMKNGRAGHGPRLHGTAYPFFERLGLSALQARYPHQLSGGQQQRVALARALASDPDLLLLDEPLSALDAPLRRELRVELAQTLREWGKPAVLVTHDLTEAYQIADLVVLCEDGRTSAAVSKQDLLWNPSSERMARLIGARNILRGTVADSSPDAITVGWRGGLIQAASSPSHPLDARPGDELAFFVRPEYVRLVRQDRAVEERARHPNIFRGAITGARDEGTSWLLFFRVHGPGEPSQGTYDLEIDVPTLVYERLGVAARREWDVSIHPGAVQVLPHG